MTPKAWTKAQVGQRAEAFALSVDFLPGDSLEPLVERLGGRVYVGERPDGPSGGPSGLSLYRNGFEIRLPNLTTTERLRFTIAHELGHWVLHRTQGQETGPLDCRNDRNDQTRWEANWFAAALLMPEDHFRQSCRHFNNNPLLVAPRYICSPKQVWLRMETLGLANYSKG